jgi:holo-[acyl-carrier protein] synthase
MCRPYCCFVAAIRVRDPCKTTPQQRDGGSNELRTAQFFSVQRDGAPNFHQPVMLTFPTLHPQQSPGRVGIDLAQVSAIENSLRAFGDRFAHRLFTQGELDYAASGRGVRAQRLAARFAAKEAVIKALGLSEAGVSWRDIEVIKLADGACAVALHGRAAQIAQAMGARHLSLSLSHEGDYAGAVVSATFDRDNP